MSPSPTELHGSSLSLLSVFGHITTDPHRMSKMAEVYAGFSEYTDAQVGRIIDYLEQTGQLDNTIVFYAADNGASGEGVPERVGEREQVLQRLPR